MELFARCGNNSLFRTLLNEAVLLKTIDREGICQEYIDEPFFINWVLTAD